MNIVTWYECEYDYHSEKIQYDSSILSSLLSSIEYSKQDNW
jgi:hypothetical protein